MPGESFTDSGWSSWSQHAAGAAAPAAATAAPTAPGRYEFIQVQLDESRSNVVDAGQVEPLQVPSEKIKLLGGFEFLEDGTTTVLLDFDAEQSLVLRGNGEWLLKPVILMADVAMS